MTTPIDRAVEAIENELAYSIPLSAAYPRAARAALATPREPTPEMIAAGLAATGSWLDIEGSGLTIAREKMRRRWCAMHDTMMATPEGPEYRTYRSAKSTITEAAP